MNDPVILLFGRTENGSGQALQQGQTSFLQHSQGLPGNVHLLTLKDNGDGQILLRLAHLYQVCLAAPSLLLFHASSKLNGPHNAAMQSSVQSLSSAAMSGMLISHWDAFHESGTHGSSTVLLAQVDEETSLAKSAEVDLNKLFKDLKFSSGEELALSAGQPLSKARLMQCPGPALASCLSGTLIMLTDERQSSSALKRCALGA